MNGTVLGAHVLRDNWSVAPHELTAFIFLVLTAMLKSARNRIPSH